MNKRWLPTTILILAILGLIDSGYLTYEHFQNTIPPCSASIFADCGKVLKSKYSEIFGIPLAVLGLIYYSFLTSFSTHVLLTKKRVAKFGVLIFSSFGFLFSLYFVYLQLIIIKAICVYCMLSAIISISIFILTQIAFPQERKRLFAHASEFLYKYVAKNILFLIDAETVHDSITSSGNLLGKVPVAKKASKYLLCHKFPELKQKITGIEFQNPVGLAAGFDYEAKLTQFLPSIGFGFETVGTITNMAYAGNPRPRLGRLPNSKSLMVNKGFKSSGAKNVVNNLKGLNFEIPLGISIGRTNSSKLKTQKQSIKDIVSAFEIFETSNVKHSYYELNISCPNLSGDISFYSPKNLKELLVEVDKLKLKRPLFVKMPIIKSDKETLAMLKIISKHSPSGVIFGNLQKDRKHASFDQNEVKKFKVGNFSGKPTFQRSNELIKLAYKHHGDRLAIIGCGGVSSGRDAYEKITLGASLIQLITGLIYQGPQLVSQINFELVDLLSQNGFKNISQAVGSRNKRKK